MASNRLEQLLIQAIASGAINTQLMSSNVPVEEIIVFNALAITDTEYHFSSDIDLSKYKAIFAFAKDTHDQDIALYYQINASHIRVWNGTSWGVDSITLSENSITYALNTKWTWLNDKPQKTVRLMVLASTAPTTGSLTVKIWGVPN